MSWNGRLASACVGVSSMLFFACSAGDAPPPAGDVFESGGSAGSGSASGGSGATTGGSVGAGGSGGGGTTGGSSSGSGGSAASGGSGGSITDPGTLPPEAMLPARVRRLTNEEYAASVRELLGEEVPAEAHLPPDARQDGFTRNEAQRVDPVLAKQLDASAQILASRARPRFAELAPCQGGDGAACAEAFIRTFGARAYRRPLSEDEMAGLVAVFHAGAETAAYEDGIELVVRAMLQSTGFLYVTELGDGGGAGTFELLPHELAAQLSYLVAAKPPGAELLASAEAGALATPEGRVAAAQALMELDSGRAVTLRYVREWIGVDRILETGKDSTVYPMFTDAVRTSMAGEVDAFVAGVASENGSVADLLGADWTFVDQTLAQYYGLSYPGGGGFQRVSLDDRRRGLLNQGAFLSVYAHASESAPVLRGVALLERLACDAPESPAATGVDIPPAPQPDGVSTTRERFETLHGQNPSCQGCHVSIDAMGFPFEAFDGAGQYRSTENGKPIDTVVDVPSELSLELEGSLADSAALADALAASPVVRACFARHLFRSAAAVSGDAVKLSEDAFVAAWRADPDAESGNLRSSVLAYVRSPLFSSRRAP